MDRKNIWIINQYTGSPYHGMNYRSYYLGKELNKKGHDITIFSGSYSHLFSSYPKVKGLFTEEKIDALKYIWVKTPKYKNSKSIGRILNMLIFMFNLFFFNIFKMNKPDIIIVSSLSIFPILNAYIWSKIFKIDIIFEVRDIWPLTLVELGNISTNHPFVKILAWFERFAYKKSKYVVSLLPNAKKHMVSKGMTNDKFIHIPNGINLDEVENYKIIDSNVKKQIPTDKFIIGYVGTIGIANALEYLIESAKCLKFNRSIHFVIVGKGGEKEKLRKICLDNDLENITFIEPIPKKQVQSILSLFDVCYIGWHNQKIYEYGISANKIFDYMYSSKPILHSISISNDIILKANCGLTVPSENVNSIVNAILELEQMSKEKLIKFGLNGKEYVIKNHSYEKLVEKYLELI